MTLSGLPARVPARARLRLAVALGCLTALAGASSASAASSGLTYYGGPVAHSMNVVLVEWGSTVRSTYTDPSTGDPAFFSYLASQSGSTNDLGGVLAQYMDTSGSNSQNKFSYAGTVQISPGSATTVQDSTIQSELSSNIAAGTVPAPAGNGLSTVYVVLFPPNTNVCDGTCAYSRKGFCAYHSSFQLPSSTQVLYAAMVDNGPGTPNYGLCGPSPNDLENQTDVVSHEFAESINDPLVGESGNTFGPPLAWYNPAGGEIGDICVGADEQTANGPWTVQRIWSNLDQSCVAAESAYSAPTASFLAPTSSTAGRSVGFDASSSSDPPSDRTFPMSYSGASYSVGSGIVGYRWDWGDGSPISSGSGAATTHVYGAPGNYNVSLTVTDALGFTSTVTQQISIAGAPPPPPLSPPSVTTGAASKVTSSAATVAGAVNPRGASTTYHVEYGTTRAYGHSTVPASAGSGNSSLAVSAGLGGLRPKTTYHYRLVATSAGGTSVGADRTFTTAKALAPAPRFSYHVEGRPTVARALGHGLQVTFSCSKACLSHFTVLLVPPGGVLQFSSSLVTVARGQGRLRSRGSSSATLRFIAKARRRLAGQHSLELLVSGYASSPGSTASAPRTFRIKLRS